MSQKVWDIAHRRYDVRFRYRLIRRPSRHLTVFLPSLVAPEKIAADHLFQRLSWAGSIRGSCLYVADPGIQLAPGVRGNWFIGNDRFHSLERVAHDLRDICREFGFAELTLVGSSQGGFAALGLGRFFPDATIIAEAPQSDMRLYNDRRAVEAALLASFGTCEVPERFAQRVDLVQLYAEKSLDPGRVKVLVKASDTHHRQVHISRLQAMCDGLQVILCDDNAYGSGHTPLIPQQVIAHLPDADPGATGQGGVASAQEGEAELAIGAETVLEDKV